MNTTSTPLVDGAITDMTKLPLIRLILAILSFVFMPVVAFASAKVGYDGILAQTAPNPTDIAAAADHLANKSMAYWFVCLALVAAGSWTWIAKWLINQLEQQRTTNADINKQLIDYISKDHAASQVALREVTSCIERNTNCIEKNTRVLESIDKKTST
jgi:hypothetical protein